MTGNGLIFGVLFSLPTPEVGLEDPMNPSTCLGSALGEAYGPRSRVQCLCMVVSTRDKPKGLDHSENVLPFPFLPQSLCPSSAAYILAGIWVNGVRVRYNNPLPLLS